MNETVKRNQQIDEAKFELCERLSADAVDNEELAGAIAASASDRHLEMTPLVNWLWARLVEYRMIEKGQRPAPETIVQ